MSILAAFCFLVAALAAIALAALSIRDARRADAASHRAYLAEQEREHLAREVTVLRTACDLYASQTRQLFRAGAARRSA